MQRLRKVLAVRFGSRRCSPRPYQCCAATTAAVMLIVSISILAASGIPPEFEADFPGICREEPERARLAFDSLLVRVDLGGEDALASFGEMAATYLAATSETTLVNDLAFVRSLSPKLRQSWIEAVTLDAESARILSDWNRGTADASLPHAVQKLDRAIPLYEKTGDLRREAVARGSLGVVLYRQRDLAGAREAYQGALKARKRLGDEVLIGRTLNALGSVANELGQLDEAVRYYEEARKVRERIGDRAGLASTLTYLGSVHYKRGDLVPALEYCEKALATFPEGSPAQHETEIILANVYSDVGELRRGLELYQSIKQYYQDSQNPRPLAAVKGNIAQSLAALGDYPEALAELHECLEIQETLADSSGIAATLNKLCTVYIRLGDFERALEAVTRARTIAELCEDHAQVANATTNKGFVHYRQGESEEALTSFQAAIEYRSTHGDTAGASDDLAMMADVRTNLGQLDAAFELYQQALDLDERAGNDRAIARDWVGLGNTLNALGQPEDGRPYFTRSAEWARTHQDRDVLFPAYLGLADGYEIAGAFDSARAYNYRAIEASEASRTLASGELSESVKIGFAEDKAFVYEAQIHILGKLHAQTSDESFIEEAFEVAEANKARVLRELLLESRLRFAGGMNQYVDPELEEVRRELASIDYRIRQLSVDGSVISLAALGAARDDLDRKRKRLEERARLRNPRLAAVSAGEPARLSDIRSGLHLDSKTVLLTYSLGDSASYLWVVRSDSTTLHRLPPSDFLATAVARCRDRIVGFGMRNTSVSGGDTDALAKDRGVGRLGPAASEADERLDPSTNLYDLLVKPAAHAIDTAERAIIVPDGALHLLPFEALVREEPSAPSAPPRYAFENVEVHYGPSATTLVYLAKARDERRRSHNSMDLLAVGDPDLGTSGREADVRASHLERLPFTREEVLAAREFFPGDRNTVLLGPEAQERTLREIALEQYRILHLATHGIFDEEDPDRSGLVMSFPSDSTHDGYLEAWEIGKLELNAELVVLSACETGLGRLVRGEGLLSLPRAFFYAGANAVIVSLWKVPDESTSLFMKAFYRALVQEKTTPAKALSLARKSLRADPRFEHPFYWAAFVLLAPPSS